MGRYSIISYRIGSGMTKTKFYPSDEEADFIIDKFDNVFAVASKLNQKYEKFGNESEKYKLLSDEQINEMISGVELLEEVCAITPEEAKAVIEKVKKHTEEIAGKTLREHKKNPETLKTLSKISASMANIRTDAERIKMELTNLNACISNLAKVIDDLENKDE